jgi:tetratricopeptide (TPR) repeat protein
MSRQVNYVNYEIAPPPSVSSFLLDKESLLTHSFLKNDDLRDIYLQASKCHKEGDWQGAIEAYKELVDLLPRNSEALPSIYGLIGFFYYKVENYGEAARYNKKYIKYYPDDDSAHYGLGVMYLLLGKIVRAIQSLKEAIKLSPEDEEYHSLLGYLYAKSQEWRLAEKHYKESIRLKSDFEKPYKYLAELYVHLGLTNLAKSKDYFSKAMDICRIILTINPHCSEMYNNIGFIYSWFGNNQAALEALQKAVELDPSNELARKNILALKNAIVKERLLKKGSIERIPEPITDFTPYKKRKLLQVKGKPLSQTIIEERR